MIITGVRDETGVVNPDEAKEQAAALYAAGEAKLGTDEEVFNRVLSHSSFAQLRLVFEEYKNLSGQTIEQAVNHEIGGELKEAIMAISKCFIDFNLRFKSIDLYFIVVECVQSPPAFFAKRLNDAMSGAGTDDTTLIRVIVSRSEIDLGTVKAEYERIYNRTLLSAVKV